MTGNVVTVPGLTTGNEVSEIMTVYEDVQRTMEKITRMISKFVKQI